MSGSSVAGVGASDAAAGPRDGDERSLAVVDPVDEAGPGEALDVRVGCPLAQPVRQREGLEADDFKALDPAEQLEAPGSGFARSSTHRSTAAAIAVSSTRPYLLRARAPEFVQINFG